MTAARRPRRSGRRPARWSAYLAALLVLVVPLPAWAGPPPPLTPPPVVEPGDPPPGWPVPDGVEVLPAYLLLDATTGQVLAGRGIDTPRPVASTIKVLTALSAVRRVDLEEQVTVGDEVLQVPGAGVGLVPGETWTVAELVDAAIARSGNDAAQALAVHVAGDVDAFLRLMEQDAAALGLTDLELVSVTGLDDTQLLSARELATIARAALQDPVLGPRLAARRVTLPGLGEVSSRNQLLARRDATGVKTGFTTPAGYTLIGSAERGEARLITVVLGAEEDQQRFTLSSRLLDTGFERFGPVELGGRLRLTVAGGHVDLVVDPVALTVPVGRPARLVVPLPVQPPPSDVVARVEVDAATYARRTARRDPTGLPEHLEGGPELARALVDGVYAALRATVDPDEVG